MKLNKLVMATLVVGLLTLNGCMLKHVFSDDEDGMSGHEGMPMHGMMHSSDDETMDMEEMKSE